MYDQVFVRICKNNYKGNCTTHNNVKKYIHTYIALT